MLDREQAPAVGMMARYGGDLHGLAAECVGHVDALPADQGYAIAKMADMIDDQALNHGGRR